MSVEEPKKVPVGGIVSLTILGIVEPILLIYLIVFFWPPQQSQVDRMLYAITEAQDSAAAANTAEDEAQAAATQAEAAAAKTAANKEAAARATIAKSATRKAAAAKAEAAKAPNDKAAADLAATATAAAFLAREQAAKAAKQAAAAKEAAEAVQAQAATGNDAAAETEDTDANADESNDNESVVGWRITAETRLILLVLLVGALGSYIGLATSFVAFAGNRKLGRSWLPWYLLRPFMGSAIALLFYFAVRGGFLSPESDVESINIFGILAIAGLAGLFSKRATAKLEEVFKAMFKTDEDKELEDKLDKAERPVIQDHEPKRWPAGKKLTDFTITGTNFTDASKIQFGEEEHEPKVRSATELKIDLSADDLEEPGTIDVKVVNPEDQGGASGAKKFTIENESEGS